MWLLWFAMIIFSCKKTNDNTDGNLTNTGNSGMLPTFDYKVNGVVHFADSFHVVLKNCPSCGYRKIYFVAYNAGVNNFKMEFLPSLGNHHLSTADAVLQYFTVGGSWLKSQTNGSLQVNELDTLGNIISGQFAFTDSTFTISEGNFYANQLRRQ